MQILPTILIAYIKSELDLFPSMLYCCTSVYTNEWKLFQTMLHTNYLNLISPSITSSHNNAPLILTPLMNSSLSLLTDVFVASADVGVRSLTFHVKTVVICKYGVSTESKLVPRTVIVVPPLQTQTRNFDAACNVTFYK